MSTDGAKAFLISLKRQEEAAKKLNPLPFKPNINEEAAKFVEKATSYIEDIEIDYQNPGFFDDTFYDELTQSNIHQLQKAETNLQTTGSTDTSELNYVDDQYFGNSVSNLPPETKIKHMNHVEELPSLEIANAETFGHAAIDEPSEMGVIDDQYFGNAVNPSCSINSVKRIVGQTSYSDVVDKDGKGTSVSNSDKDFCHIDAQYFGNRQISNEEFTESSGATLRNNLNQSRTDLDVGAPINSSQIGTSKHVVYETENFSPEYGLEENEKSTNRNMNMPEPKGFKDSVTVQTQKKKSLFGVNMLRDYLPDLSNQPSYEVVDLLMDTLIFHDEKIICLNKPYSLHSQGGPNVHHSVHKYLPEIAKRLNYDGSLHLCHRLDKDACGALLVAKGEEQSVKMKTRFEKGEIEKTYLAITVGVPKPMTGVIDIPIATESLVKGNYKSILLPMNTKTRRRGVNLAETAYNVLRHNETAALVELRPHTGRKHQLRVHLADGLSTPILGDHKYSHRDKMAPQRLTKDILAKFRIEQSQVRSMPMHLHAQKLVLPNYFPSGKELILSARLSEFFQKSIKRLKFFR